MMQIWILTGDKLETAVNIAYSCGHFKRSIDLLELKTENESEFLENKTLLQFRLLTRLLQIFFIIQ